MNNQIIIDPHDLTGKKETWTIDFEHYISTNNHDDRPGLKNTMRINIHLEAFRKGLTPAMDEHIDIGNASFIVGHKPETIILHTHPDAEVFVDALVAAGLAQRKGQTVERYTDYPGADEIEEFRYQHLDVTGFYNEYIKEKLEDLLDITKSPLTHITLCQGQTINGKNPEDYITCRIGGIEQKKAWTGFEGRKMFDVVRHYPEARYHIQEMAQKAYAQPLELYRQAQKRVTDPRQTHRTGNWYISCKIDGRQMLSREVNRLDWCDYQINKDFAALAAKYYPDTLANTVKTEKTMTR